MAVTHKLIQTITVGAGGQASIEFTSIPQTYTDLLVVYSARTSRSAVYDAFRLTFNGSTTNYSSKYLQGNGSSASSFSGSTSFVSCYVNGATSTSNTFSNNAFYIPNYTSSTYKSLSGEHLYETNATAADMFLTAGLWSNTAAITSISVTSDVGATIVQYSSASLYGILKS